MSLKITNRYGHSHEETIERLEKSGTKVFRTDKSGSIIIQWRNEILANTKVMMEIVCETDSLDRNLQDSIVEQIESKKAKGELFKGFIRTLVKQDGLIEEFDAGIWSSLVQEVVVKAKDDIRFIFKNGFEVRV